MFRLNGRKGVDAKESQAGSVSLSSNRQGSLPPPVSAASVRHQGPPPVSPTSVPRHQHPPPASPTSVPHQCAPPVSLTSVRGLFRTSVKSEQQKLPGPKETLLPNYRVHSLLPKKPVLLVGKAVDKCLSTAGVDGSVLKALTHFPLSIGLAIYRLDRGVSSTMRPTIKSILRMQSKGR